MRPFSKKNDEYHTGGLVFISGERKMCPFSEEGWPPPRHAEEEMEKAEEEDVSLSSSPAEVMTFE